MDVSVTWGEKVTSALHRIFNREEYTFTSAGFLSAQLVRSQYGRLGGETAPTIERFGGGQLPFNAAVSDSEVQTFFTGSAEGSFLRSVEKMNLVLEFLVMNTSN